MCNQFTFHHQFGIDTWRSNFEQMTDSVLSACGSYGQKSQGSDTIDLSVPRHAQYLHKAWKRLQDAVYWVDINLALKKGLKFYQARTNAIILHETLPSYCIPKVVGMETGEVIYEKYTCHLGLHQRSPYVTTGKENWVQNMLNDQKDKLCNNLEVSNRTNQFQTKVVIDRGNPLSELTREPCKMEEKRPVPRNRCKFFSRRNCFFG